MPYVLKLCCVFRIDVMESCNIYCFISLKSTQIMCFFSIVFNFYTKNKVLTVLNTFISESGSCFTVASKGHIYRGNVDYTSDFYPCLAWKEVSHCPFNPYAEGCVFHGYKYEL